MRHYRLFELLKDYDITIIYHPGKANVVVDGFSRKTCCMGNLEFLRVEERPLALKVQSLTRQMVQLVISLPHSVLEFIKA